MKIILIKRGEKLERRKKQNTYITKQEENNIF